MRIVRYRVLVSGDVYFVKATLEFLSGYAERTQIEQSEMIIGTARNKIKALGQKRLGKSL